MWIYFSKITMETITVDTSLNPCYTIANQVSESFKIEGGNHGSSDIRRKVIGVLSRVKIPSAERRMKDYPFQFSGGMRQRVLAAMAISRNPRLLIADEPTTSLDVTIQDQFLRLLKDMQKQNKMGLIMITHDLGIVAETCDRVVIMYAGKIVEKGTVKQVFLNPAHPYTEALLEALPKMGSKKKRLFQIEGEPPNLLQLPGGCSFWPRCRRVMDICQTKSPPFTSLDKDGEDPVGTSAKVRENSVSCSRDSKSDQTFPRCCKRRYTKKIQNAEGGGWCVLFNRQGRLLRSCRRIGKRQNDNSKTYSPS